MVLCDLCVTRFGLIKRETERERKNKREGRGGERE